MSLGVRMKELRLKKSLSLQDVADKVGITYRAVQRILDELQQAGYITRERKKDDARSNQYRMNTKLRLRHPLEQHRSVATLLELGVPGGKGY